MPPNVDKRVHVLGPPVLSTVSVVEQFDDTVEREPGDDVRSEFAGDVDFGVAERREEDDLELVARRSNERARLVYSPVSLCYEFEHARLVENTTVTHINPRLNVGLPERPPERM